MSRMGKASEIWKEIKPKIGEMLMVVNNIETQTEKAQEEAYQKGLSDAWEAVTKIANMPYGEEEKVFGSGGWKFIINHTASEAIEKIRQYEQEKEEIIDPDKNKVEALANDIGIHKLYALVKEIRGE